MEIIYDPENSWICEGQVVELCKGTANSMVPILYQNTLQFYIKIHWLSPLMFLLNKFLHFSYSSATPEGFLKIISNVFGRRFREFCRVSKSHWTLAESSSNGVTQFWTVHWSPPRLSNEHKLVERHRPAHFAMNALCSLYSLLLLCSLIKSIMLYGHRSSPDMTKW